MPSGRPSYFSHLVLHPLIHSSEGLTHLTPSGFSSLSAILQSPCKCSSIHLNCIPFVLTRFLLPDLYSLSVPNFPSAFITLKATASNGISFKRSEPSSL